MVPFVTYKRISRNRKDEFEETIQERRLLGNPCNNLRRIDRGLTEDDGKGTNWEMWRKCSPQGSFYTVSGSLAMWVAQYNYPVFWIKHAPHQYVLWRWRSPHRLNGWGDKANNDILQNKGEVCAFVIHPCKFSKLCVLKALCVVSVQTKYNASQPARDLGTICRQCQMTQADA